MQQYTRADLIGYHSMCPTWKMMFSSTICISRQIGTMQLTLDIQITLFRHIHVATTLHKYCKSTTCGVLMPDKFRALILIIAANRSPYSGLGWESLTKPDQVCLQMQTWFSCSRDNSADSMTYLIAYHTLSWVTSNQRYGSVFLGTIKVCKSCKQSVSYYCGYFCTVKNTVHS